MTTHSTWGAAEDNPYRDLLSAGEKSIRNSYSLDRTKILQDLLVLERILTEGYSGYDALQSEGFDWPAFFQGMASDISSQEKWRQREFLDLLREYIGRVPDLHLGLFFHNQWIPCHHPDRVFFTGIKVRKEPGLPLRIIDGPRNHSDAIGGDLVGIDGEASKEYLFETVPEKPEARDYFLGKWSHQEKPDSVHITVETKEGNQVGWEQTLHSPKVRLSGSMRRPFRMIQTPFPKIEIRTFSTLVGLDLKRFLDSADRAREREWVVVDLRGNPGGSDHYAREWLLRLHGGNSPGWKVSELISPVTLQGNVILHRWLFSRARSEAEREQSGGRLAFALEELEKAENQQMPTQWKTHDAAPVEILPNSSPFDGKLLILVDSNTGSSAETFVLMAKQYSQAIVVGENTRGMARFGEIKLYSLPNSTIRIQAGSKIFHDPTGLFTEGRGFVPDYWLEGSEPISEIVERLELTASGD